MYLRTYTIRSGYLKDQVYLKLLISQKNSVQTTDISTDNYWYQKIYFEIIVV